MNTYILPAIWASALINNDRSGLNSADLKELDDFLNKENPGGCISCSEEEYFTKYNDAGVLACNVLEFNFPSN